MINLGMVIAFGALNLVLIRVESLRLQACAPRLTPTKLLLVLVRIVRREGV
jgi:hypothetical protein